MSLHVNADPFTNNYPRVQKILSDFERQYLPTYKMVGMGYEWHPTFINIPSKEFEFGFEGMQAVNNRLELSGLGTLDARFWYGNPFHYWAGQTTVKELEVWLRTSPYYFHWREKNPDLRDTPEDLVSKTIRDFSEALCGTKLEIGCKISSIIIKKDWMVV